ncbi:cytochrome c [Novosphingobium sp. AP12]|uniref:cytochrome c n=1 Tax=Novosphingobium sp. AP12 TaxID=1144305 RepID=UPI0002FECFAE|nr:cytochrome c [Novosphingobium sp. AP12]
MPAPLTAIQSSSITLPTDEQTFGAGQDAALLDRSCLACHSASMILYQPPLTRKQWTATVDKMREAYRAPIEARDTEAIVDALMAKAPSSR